MQTCGGKMDKDKLRKLAAEWNQKVIHVDGTIFIPEVHFGEKIIREGTLVGDFRIDKATLQEEACGLGEYFRTIGDFNQRKIGPLRLLDTSLYIIDKYTVKMEPLPPREMTIAEIEKVVGCPVKVVADK